MGLKKINLKMRYSTSQTITSSDGSAIEDDSDDAEIRFVVNSSLDGSDFTIGMIFAPAD